MTRHGRTARTSTSAGDPALLGDPTSPSSSPSSWLTAAPERGDAPPPSRAGASQAELVGLAGVLLVAPTAAQRNRAHAATELVLDWLETFPGGDWQDRWILSGSDEHGSGWGPSGLSPGRRARFTAGMCALLALQAVRPSYRWLFASRMLGTYDTYRRHNQTATFGRLHRHLTERGGCDEYTGDALNLVTRMVIVTGKDVLDLDLTDVAAYAQARRASGRPMALLPAGLPGAARRGRVERRTGDVGAVALPGQADPGTAGGPLSRRRPRHPRRPGPLPGRAGRGARLRLPGQPVPDAGRAVLDRPGATPPRDLLAEPAQRRRPGVEAAHPHAARRTAPAELPRRAAGRAVLLPRSAAVVAGGPGPLGTVGRPVPDPRGRRAQLRQGDPPTPSPDAAAHPHPGAGASPARRRRRGTRPAFPTRPARRPGHRARRAVHRGADPVSTHRPRPQPLAAHRSVRYRPARQYRPGTPFRCRTRGGQRLLVRRGDRGPATHRRPDRGTPRTHPPEPAPVSGTHRRDGAAAADQPVQDRPRTGRARRPRPRRGAGPHPAPHQSPRRTRAAAVALRRPRTNLRPAPAPPVPTPLPAPTRHHLAGAGPTHASRPGRAGRHHGRRPNPVEVHPPRLPPDLRHRDREQWPADPHRRETPRSPRPQYHPRVCRGLSPQEIARALHLRPAVVAPLVRKLAAEEAAAAPEPVLFGCWVSPGWSRNLTTDGHRDWPDLPVPEEGPAGIACVAVARRHRPHRVSVCGYLVDTYCLGVKNALGPEVMNERDLPGFLRDYFAPFEEVGGSLAVPLELARHLVWGAVDHARSLGFEPAHDFTAAAGHLGSWAETSAITFGRDATPCYVAGPYDNPRAIIRTLDQVCGQGNYEYLVPVG